MNKRHEVEGILWFVGAAFLFIALLPHTPGKHHLAIIGEATYAVFMFLFGFTSYAVPFILGYIGWVRFTAKKIEKPVYKIVGISVLFLSVCLFSALMKWEGLYQELPINDFLNVLKAASNAVGALLFVTLVKTIGRLGGFIVCFVAIIISLYLLEIEHIAKDYIGKLLQFIKGKITMLRAEQDFAKSVRAEKEVLKKREELIKKVQAPIPEKKEIKEKPIVKPAAKPETVVVQKPRVKTGAVDYTLPDLSFLEKKVVVEELTPEDIGVKEEIIKKTLNDFGIKVEILRTVKGPVVTRFEIMPAPGTKVSKIATYQNDLAMALKATHIRVQAPIPGEAAVGIEIPNKKYMLVSIKEIFETDTFTNFKGRLPIALGKSVDGDILISDLAEMPHLLVAGSTGSGKSVCLNAIILSLIYKFTPDELKLLLIDPKRVELTLYNNLPHLYSPIMTDPRSSADSLKYLIKDMNERYDKLSEVGARDIASYNKISEEKLPYIVVIIDELADLMLVAAREIEEYITRLSQLARGVGIHLVFATQRPSVDVITGVIKANFPSRIALQVFSKVDSRVILDMGGAEDLLGKGDMLFYPAGVPKPIRGQCAYVSSQEIKIVADFWKKQGKPVYGIDNVKSTSAGLAESEGVDEELFKNSLTLVKERKRASSTLFKGALHISDGKASNLISIMETKGLIGPGIGAKPREIYFDKIEEMLGKLSEKNTK